MKRASQTLVPPCGAARELFLLFCSKSGKDRQKILEQSSIASIAIFSDVVYHLSIQTGEVFL